MTIQSKSRAGRTRDGLPGAGLELEVAGRRLVATWSPTVHAAINYADQHLALVVRGEGRTRVLPSDHLSRREVILEPGSYQVELVRSPRPELEVRTTGCSTPVVVWVQESPRSHVITWSGLDWGALAWEVAQIHHLNWQTDTELALRASWREQGQEPHLDWIPAPFRDHFHARGPLEHLELVVGKRGTREVLKSIFTARRVQPEGSQVLDRASAVVGPQAPVLTLDREVIETDSLQCRARWRLGPEWEGEELTLTLEHDGQSHPWYRNLPVGWMGDWYFGNLAPGRYRAVLRSASRPEPLLESLPLDLADPGPSITLMPIDNHRLFAYWHVGGDTWRALAERHGDLLGRVRCYLKVFHDYGGLHHHQHLDREVNLDTTRDYYLEVEPDRVYRVQLIAVIDGWKVEELTTVSNPAQTGRPAAGTAPVSHRWVPDPIVHPTCRPLDSPRGTSNYSTGFLLLHLHAHLPFIPDPVLFEGDPWRPMGYPQEWYPEAVRETYLPLLDLFETLLAEGVDFKLSIDLSPPLVAMMTSPRHQADVMEYLERLIQLARLEVERTAREEPHYHEVARMHLGHLSRCRDLFLGYGCDLAAAFRRFQDLGKLEILTCVGTHPMLPLWQSQPQAIRGQIRAAQDYHQQIFGRPSVGIWLPECAYAPGVEQFLDEAGLRYFFSEADTVLRGDSPAEFGVNAPVYVRGSRVAVFPRDPETGQQVWSGETGYPGDPDYLDFHIRGGPFKYNRITDRSSGLNKQPYVPAWADAKAASQAQHFVDCRRWRFEYLRHVMWKKPLVVAPYDAELFGHHWYEGPKFLYYVFKKLHYDQNSVELITPSSYLALNPTAQEMWPTVSSWGDKASFDKWMYGATSWMYRHGHEAAREMGRMARAGAADETGRRLLAQAARQLCLAMASDLPFVISNGHFVDRMKRLFFGALEGFWQLAAAFWRHRQGGEVDLGRLRELELENCIFPGLDPGAFAAPL
ncbi:MAG TPA: 1,4-alpha-glucan branching protein domain-containing protein [Candidatus Nitrosotenuis sp.]|jgi:predicted glycosyl hydrolase (DUF1957 family)|nr:1,4-alpha-glucan branching protein domain-containing protein [Candidatus Nitrosotenuis sp.]